MKRGWRPGRILLAALLAGMAACILYAWPKQPLWSCLMLDERIVGFDVDRNLFYSTSQNDTGQWLHSYCLATGKLIHSQVLPKPKDQTDSKYWPLTLSGDKRLLLALSTQNRDIRAFLLPSLAVVEIKRSNEALIPWSYGMSQDGTCLVVRDVANGCDRFEILDLETANSQIVNIPYDASTVAIAAGSFNTLPMKAIVLTADHRYLAAQVLGGTVLYDLLENREIVRTRKETFPRLTANGQTIVCLSAHDSKTVQFFYQLQAGRWVERSGWTAPFLEREYFIQFCQDFLVTGWDEVYQYSWLRQLPTAIQSLAQKVLTGGRVHLRFWDLNTGKEHPELNFSLPVSLPSEKFDGINFLAAARFSSHLRISADARYVAFRDQDFLATEDEDYLSIWKTNFHRPWSCWLMVSGIGLSAGWLAWPRKVKAA